MFIRYLSIILITVFVSSCWRPAGVGIGGQYLDAKTEIVKGRRGDVNKAVANLEYVVVRDPYYKDTLTLLGRAYYMGGRYQDAYQILRRALTIRPEDEIAWISLGLTELRLGNDAKGLESLKGGLTLFAKVSKEGYRGVEFWDSEGYVRTAMRRAVLAAMKGLEEKERIIQSGEVLLGRIDDEEWWADRKDRRDRLTPTD
jgi:tetratricopeptide (TPR) repeat protein